ncbi:ATP-binding cassette domain-containing protein [Kroppenstedtia pulmonis]|uniref:ATP-binding cassette domain-containing protein n=1 Tax=Kroppenstedtia pulmonis TaxID=1380685 RepID=A0A7D4BXP4_9BACL|nr:ATP-binding cassette domain-containing protein [Kroppenstedtia pulmonis]QKG85553.1 ATP-binding cassette domain-containing protein [Kroppenstedtia pulmonis]
MNPTLIRLHNVSKRYLENGEEKIILSSVNATVEQGKIIMLTGPSGSGKSTLLRLLNRLENADQGEIIYKDKPVQYWDPVQLRREVQYVFQSPILFSGTVSDNLAYPLSLQGKKLQETQMEQLLDRVGLTPATLNQSVSSLSGGEKQRVHLARSLSLQPEMLLLDEVTASLDNENAIRIEEEMRHFCLNGGTVVWISHQQEQVKRIADEIWKLEKGQLIIRKMESGGQPR